MEKAICVNCRKHVEYELQKTEACTHVKGKRISYTHTTAHCKECGMEVWVGEVDEENSVAPLAAYCKMVGKAFLFPETTMKRQQKDKSALG